jgi:DNA-binding response OmpR family regulator
MFQARDPHEFVRFAPPIHCQNPAARRTELMRIAILEDDPDQQSHLVRTLEHLLTVGDTTVACTTFADGTALQGVLRRESFDLLVLDWNVPGLEGVELLKWLRTWQRDLVPVLMLSSRASEQDVVQALNFGADDYIVKPFRPLELRARVQRLMARRTPVAQSDQERFGRWEFDRLTQSVLIHPVAPPGAPAERHALTDREFKLALTLFQHIGGVVSRAHLLESAGYSSEELPSRTLDSHIYRLRSKLGLEAERGLSLRTVYGRGYRLEATQQAEP